MALNILKAKSKVPVLFIAGGISLICFGFFIQIYIANTALDLHFHDTYWVIPHFHLLIFISLFFLLFAAIYYLFPKVFGRYMNRTLGYIHFFMTLAGVFAIFWPMHNQGIAGVPHRYYDYSAWESFKQFSQLNQFICVTVIMVFSGQLLFALNFIISIFTGRRVKDT